MLMRSRKTAGFTLVELMISLALNALLFSALLYVFVANLNHYRKSLNVNRLNQQLQTTLLIMSNDIRRAGYWANAKNDIGLDQNNNPFMVTATNVTVTGGNCILFTYDRNDNGTLPSIGSGYDDERYGFRLTNGAVQTRPPGASYDCDAAASAWENMTDTRTITITALSFTLNTSTLTTGPGTVGITTRSVDISITGQVTGDASTSTTLTQHVRLRNDKFVP